MPAPDFMIIGAGVVGLSVARELARRYPDQSILILEKESRPAVHSSGRNSGVLHSGIYYPVGSLKAEVCRQGAAEMAQFHDEHGIPLHRCGKLLVATSEADDKQLTLLAQRGKAQGIEVEWLDAQQLREAEPEARSLGGRALRVPTTAVGTPHRMMEALRVEVEKLGCEIRCCAEVRDIDVGGRNIRLANGTRLSFGHAVNAAGLHSDTIAHRFGVGRRYTLLPFKGIYWKLDPAAGFRLRHLIYPVPDLRVPFLGIHTTTTTDGLIYVGPTAVPAFGRENYRGMKGITGIELVRIFALLAQQYAKGTDGFRRLAWQEGFRCFKRNFAEAAAAILPRLRPENLLPAEKVGIRAQMLDRTSGHLVNDFLVEAGPASTHILNAISPAWTSAFPFARLVCDNFISRVR